MRSQSNELLQIAKELRDYVRSLNLPSEENAEGKNIGVWLHISDKIRIHYRDDIGNYASVEFSKWPKTVTVQLFEDGDYTNNTITINVESVDDVELQTIILLVQADIAIFKATKLIEDVHSSSSSI
jgi:hypothetical protein